MDYSVKVIHQHLLVQLLLHLGHANVQNRLHLWLDIKGIHSDCISIISIIIISIIIISIITYRKRGLDVTLQSSKHERSEQSMKLSNHLLLLPHIGRFLQVEQRVKRVLRSKHLGHEEVEQSPQLVQVFLVIRFHLFIHSIHQFYLKRSTCQ